ncbi:hypothetical protein OS493_027423 [Desmophyllum pertusum]|uniref:Major facilitator superfamily (MFS) profile domain-containing protein n=1 Tax=Desmophyllum pertusum TaxID=174260 RepID=A0A9W9YNT5_9CNID|nr:hypothetical protein OS493_027423 [Desmophyllum pertusum]
MEEFGSGKAKSAWVGSIHLFALYAVAPFVTMACDLWGCRITAFVGGVLCVVGLAASSFVTQLYPLFVTYGVVFGLGASLAFVTTFRIISQWFKRNLALVNGICTAGAYSGTIVFGPFLQHMVILRGLYGTFVIMAGITSITAVAALAYRQPPGKDNVNEKPVQAKDVFDLTLLKDKSFLVFLLGISLYAFGNLIPASYAPSFARESGVSQDKVAYLLMAWSISSCIFSFFTGKLADRFSNHRVQIVQSAMIGVATSTSLISAASSFQSFIALMVMYGAFDSSFVLLRPVVAEDLVGSNKASRGVGLMFAALGFAYLSGIPLAGWIYDVTHSYPSSFIVASVFSAIGCILLFLIPLLHVSQKRLPDTPESTDRISHLEQEKSDSIIVQSSAEVSEPITIPQSQSLELLKILHETCL